MNITTVDVGAPLTPRDVVAVARLGAQVSVGEEAMERVRRAADLVESLAAPSWLHLMYRPGVPLIDRVCKAGRFLQLSQPRLRLNG